MAEEFKKKIEKINPENTTYQKLENLLLQENWETYHSLLKKKINVTLHHFMGHRDYTVFHDDFLLMLKFHYRAKSGPRANKHIDDAEKLDKIDEALIYLHLPDGKKLKVSEFDTFEKLKKNHNLTDEQLVFGLKPKPTEEEIIKSVTKLQAAHRGKSVRNKEPTNPKPVGKGKCVGPEHNKNCKKTAAKKHSGVCMSYRGCKWVGKTKGKKGGRRKKKKAFPSRKKTHRKNSTKKRARK